MRPDLGPEMRPDDAYDAYDGPDGRYADLLGDDPGLTEVVGALDRLYRRSEPPSQVADKIERALAAQAGADFQRGEQRASRARWNRWGAGLPPQGGAGRTDRKGTATMTMTRKRLSTLAAVAAAAVVVGLMALLLRGFGPGSGVGSGGGTPTTGNVFAHSGGIEVVAALSCVGTPKCDLATAQQHVVPILTQRLSTALMNVPALDVRPLGATDIVIDVAGMQTAAAVLPLLDVGGFAVLDTGPTQLAVGTNLSGLNNSQGCGTSCTASHYHTVFIGANLDTASIQVAIDQQTGQPVILFAFAGADKDRFAQYTGSHIGQYLTITVDDVVVESAVIQSQIDGQAEVSGIASMQQAHKLAAFMKYGALPAALTVISTQTVPAGGHPQSGASLCVTPTPGAALTVTPGPQAKYVQNVTTARAVDFAIYSPVNPTSYFPVNSDVFVTASVRNITAGQQHTISIQWFLQGQDLQLGASGELSRSITQNTTVYFSLRYPTAGLGAAKIYFDRPANDPDGDTVYLAATIEFFVQNASAPVPTPTPMPYVGGSGAGSGPSCPNAAPPQTPAPGPTPMLGPTATPGGPTPTPPPTPTPTTGP